MDDTRNDAENLRSQFHSLTQRLPHRKRSPDHWIGEEQHKRGDQTVDCQRPHERERQQEHATQI
eukprot:11163625-Lingulodinium_polyedra.AAC.1